MFLDFSLKRLFFSLIFMLCTVQHSPATSEKPFVLGYSNRQAIETLFRYSVMGRNPLYVEREERRKKQEAYINKILDKKGEDLTPYQQLELLQHTFDFKFSDPFVTEMTTAFVASWVLLGLTEFAWRMHCGKNPQTGFIKNKKTFIEYEGTFDLHPDEKKQFDGEALMDRFFRSAGLFRVKEFFNNLNFKEDSFDSMKRKWGESFSGKYKIGTFSGVDVRNRLSDRKNFDVYKQHEFSFNGKKPKGLLVFEAFLHWGIKLYPVLRRAIGFSWSFIHDNGAKTPGQFLEDLFKNFSSESVAGFGSPAHKSYLLDLLIQPLWKKHGGKEDRVCAELAAMGNKLRELESRVELDREKTLYSLVMGVHGGVLPFEQTKPLHVLRQAFGHGIVHRFLTAGAGEAALVFTQVLVRAFLKKHFSENFIKQKENDYVDNYGLPIFCVLFAALSFKACWTKFMNYDNKQARADYEVFLKRLSLLNKPHRESFYWAWFFPMWRAHKQDVLEVESIFLKRAEEVRPMFETRFVV